MPHTFAQHLRPFLCLKMVRTLEQGHNLYATKDNNNLWYQQIGVVDMGSNAPVDLLIMQRLHCLLQEGHTFLATWKKT